MQTLIFLRGPLIEGIFLIESRVRRRYRGSNAEGDTEKREPGVPRGGGGWSEGDKEGAREIDAEVVVG